MKSIPIGSAHRLVVIFLTGWALTACTTISYRPISSEQVFRDRVVDRALDWPGGYSVVFGQDGSITGQFPNGEVTGQWAWRDGRFCRSIAVAGIARPDECLQIELSDQYVRFKRAGGDYFSPYNIGPPVAD